MIKTSTFTIKGHGTFNVNIESPDNLVAAIGAERSNDLLRSFGHAHWVQSAIKGAFEKASDKLTADDKSLIAAVRNGTTVQFMDYVPDARGTGASKADMETAESAWYALQDGRLTNEQLAASYAKVGLEYSKPAGNNVADKQAFVAMHANKKRVERQKAKEALA